jgi:hypothetical protein
VRRLLLILCAVVVAAAAGLAAAVLLWSGVTLAGDPAALARVHTQPLGGALVSAQAFGPGGERIPLTVRRGRLTPKSLLQAGARVQIEVVVRRPGWLGWALGKERRERLSLRTPVARVTGRWLSVAAGSALRVRFDRAVDSVAYRQPGRGTRLAAGGGSSTVVLPLVRRPAAGSVEVAATARSWELPGAPTSVSWFPPSSKPLLYSRPAAGTRISPVDPIRLTFSKPVAELFGTARPTFAPRVAGRWSEPDSHTLTFTPSGLGVSLSTDLRLRLPSPVAEATGAGVAQPKSLLGWTVPPASFLRLQQLLAEEGYLPVEWSPARADASRTARSELAAAIDPPSGRFSWPYATTPPELKALWVPGKPNQIIRGAVMMFEHDHGLAVDAIAGPHVWKALLADAVAGKHRNGGYSYVFVHRSVPQKLTLWHDGNIVLTSPGNTGVPAAPTQLGTWPVFEHHAVGTMSGTNPDGSHYHDPGIRWISYFHHGEALHAFPRASFGTPQSLGCVELPLAAAAKVWPYTPIGTLVTIED